MKYNNPSNTRNLKFRKVSQRISAAPQQNCRMNPLAGISSVFFYKARDEPARISVGMVWRKRSVCHREEKLQEVRNGTILVLTVIENA